LTPHKIALAVVAALAIAAPTAMAQQEVPDTVEVSGGVTKLSLSAKAKKVLRAAGVSASGRRFAITGGEIDPADGNRADIDHRGKLTFRAGGSRIGFKLLNVELGATGRLFGTTAGQVVAIANLTGGTVARQGLHSTDVNGLRATLTRPAARALNQALETGRFKKGMVLGRVSVDAQLEEALIDSAGDTDLQIAPQAAQKLQQAGVTASPIAPATCAGTGCPTGSGLPVFTFPIVGGTMKLDQSEASVLHDGGLLLTQSSTGRQLPLSQPAVEITTPPVLTVDLGGARAAAADLDLSGMTKTGTTNGLEIGGVVVKLNASSAALLNATFSPNSPLFAAGDVVGTASSSITFQ
jgi:hypothetical protein